MKVTSTCLLGMSLKYLDLDICVQVPTLNVQCNQAEVATPLCPTSAHVFHIHTSWPGSMRSRVIQLSDDKSLALCQLNTRYTMANAHPLTLDLLGRFEKSALASVSRFVSSSVPSPQAPFREPLVCRYHPLLRTILNRTIKCVPPPAELGLRLMPAWRNYLPSMSSKVVGTGVSREGRREGTLCVFENTFHIEPLLNHTIKYALACNQ